MFSVGELVVYGGEGVCRVERIGPSTLSCADRNREYYTLRPIFHTGEVTTPVDTRAWQDGDSLKKVHWKQTTAYTMD